MYSSGLACDVVVHKNAAIGGEMKAAKSSVEHHVLTNVCLACGVNEAKGETFFC
jgi:hypothetical protein